MRTFQTEHHFGIKKGFLVDVKNECPGNNAGPSGAVCLSNVLAVNTTLLELNLGCENNQLCTCYFGIEKIKRTQQTKLEILVQQL